MRAWWKVGVVLAVACAAVGGFWVWSRGARANTVSTTSAAFVSSRFERSASGMRVLMEVTPDNEPEEAGLIYDAAKRGQPVDVVVPYRDGTLMFRVTGLLGGREFTIPCNSREECATILEANHFKVPAELAHD